MTIHLTLKDLENDLILCKNHLDGTQNIPPEIGTFLTRFLLVHICGEYEKEVKRIVVERAQQSGDPELATYVEKSIKKVRNIKTSDLRGNILGRFNEDYADVFDRKIKGTEAEIRYNTIITNRDRGAAHGGTINMTFSELLEAHEKALDVLKAVEDALR